jgi:hypothetical protein
MRQFQGFEDPPLFADAVVTVAVSEGVYLISFAAPPPLEAAQMDEFGEIEVTGGPIVATLALTTSAAISLAARLSLLISVQDAAPDAGPRPARRPIH